MCKMSANPATGLLDPCIFRVSVRKVRQVCVTEPRVVSSELRMGVRLSTCGYRRFSYQVHCKEKCELFTCSFLCSVFMVLWGHL